VCTHSEHQARTIKILQSLCASHKILVQAAMYFRTICLSKAICLLFRIGMDGLNPKICGCKFSHPCTQFCGGGGQFPYISPIFGVLRGTLLKMLLCTNYFSDFKILHSF
jgi:hypothetical protein